MSDVDVDVDAKVEEPEATPEVTTTDARVISVPLLDAIVGYLGTKPYQEVYQLIEALRFEVATSEQVTR